MAKATEITVEVKVAIPDETICRCLRVLEMWMDDNPDKRIIVNEEKWNDCYRHSIHIEPKEKYNVEPVLDEHGNQTGEFKKVKAADY